ncbi:MAG: TetR/AcrR family transcriptional regulator [Bacteroidales bacterium]|jgi:AcrR family transcriptional regulator|nr:TetR/AcrR family transcriptional regulator [Bacteroidales bacterium]
MDDFSKEKQILRAAEEVFLEKGFSASKTVEIADKAGVNHALLHYYFRTKENLFNKVFTEKMDMFIESFENLFSKNMPLTELIHSFVEAQFNFFSQNEKLPYFIIHEMMANDHHRKIFSEQFFPKLSHSIEQFNQLLQEEIRKGNIKNVRVLDLLVSITSLNMFFFVVRPGTKFFPESFSVYHTDQIIEERKQTHIDTILSWIKK